MVVQVRGLHSRLGECMASGKAAPSAISPGHGLFDKLDARILDHLETLRDKVEGQRKQQA